MLSHPLLIFSLLNLLNSSQLGCFLFPMAKLLSHGPTSPYHITKSNNLVTTFRVLDSHTELPAVDRTHVPEVISFLDSHHTTLSSSRGLRKPGF